MEAGIGPVPVLAVGCTALAALAGTLVSRAPALAQAAAATPALLVLLTQSSLQRFAILTTGLLHWTAALSQVLRHLVKTAIAVASVASLLVRSR